MSISMHAASAPVFLRMLNNMLAWLDKAQAHAEARKFDPNNYLGLRLAPDMLPFTRQVQIMSDGAKGCMARLAGQDVPKWDDTETTLDEVRARRASAPRRSTAARAARSCCPRARASR
jgi:hypothetical protein